MRPIVQIKKKKKKIHTVSTHQTAWPLAAIWLRHAQSGARRDIFCFVFFSSSLAGANTIRPLDVTMTKRCLFLVVLPPNKRDSFLWPSPCSPLPLGLLGMGADMTIRSPSFSILSFCRVSTGDQSRSSCVGGGSAVMMREGRGVSF